MFKQSTGSLKQARISLKVVSCPVLVVLHDKSQETLITFWQFTSWSNCLNSLLFSNTWKSVLKPYKVVFMLWNLIKLYLISYIIAVFRAARIFNELKLYMFSFLYILFPRQTHNPFISQINTMLKSNGTMFQISPERLHTVMKCIQNLCCQSVQIHDVSSPWCLLLAEFCIIYIDIWFIQCKRTLLLFGSLYPMIVSISHLKCFWCLLLQWIHQLN
jgi:hypothetical protein